MCLFYLPRLPGIGTRTVPGFGLLGLVGRGRLVPLPPPQLGQPPEICGIPGNIIIYLPPVIITLCLSLCFGVSSAIARYTFRARTGQHRPCFDSYHFQSACIFCIKLAS